MVEGSGGDGAGYGYGVPDGRWGREKSGDCLSEECSTAGVKLKVAGAPELSPVSYSCRTYDRERQGRPLGAGIWGAAHSQSSGSGADSSPGLESRVQRTRAGVSQESPCKPNRGTAR